MLWWISTVMQKTKNWHLLSEPQCSSWCLMGSLWWVLWWVIMFNFWKMYRFLLGMWRSSNSNFECFQQIRYSTNVLSTLSNANSWKNPCSTTDFIWYVMYRQTKSADKLFPQFSLSHKLQLLNVQHSFYSLTFYAVLIWTLIVSTLGNNIVTLLFNWPKPVNYISTVKINASIRICIQQILKVRIRMTNFITSLISSALMIMWLIIPVVWMHVEQNSFKNCCHW